MKGDRNYLTHIAEAIGDIERYASTGRDSFLDDRMRQDAIIRKLEIIGEAAKRLDDTVKALAPEIPWRQVAGMRDRLIHAYFGVDLALVWAVVGNELPLLRVAIERIGLRRPPAEPL